MIAHVTAAALVAENKQLCPFRRASTRIPTSANQEDHVSMAALRRPAPTRMAANLAGIIGIELLAAAQGCDFHAPLTSSTPLEAVRARLEIGVAQARRGSVFPPRHRHRDGSREVRCARRRRGPASAGPRCRLVMNAPAAHRPDFGRGFPRRTAPAASADGGRSADRAILRLPVRDFCSYVYTNPRSDA